jgi:hypothetical protein
MARVGNMSSGTCMREEEANIARGPELGSVINRKTGELGVVPKTSEYILTHKHKHTTTRRRLTYPLRCRGYCIEYQ